jgi:hypothetical protein
VFCLQELSASDDEEHELEELQTRISNLKPSSEFSFQFIILLYFKTRLVT